MGAGAGRKWESEGKQGCERWTGEQREERVAKWRDEGQGWQKGGKKLFKQCEKEIKILLGNGILQRR